MTERDAIYLQILTWGLLRIRDAAAHEHLPHCALEAEHLHNIPSLIGETNQQRHAYYYVAERACYLEKVDRAVPGLESTLARYAELWQRLHEVLAAGGAQIDLQPGAPAAESSLDTRAATLFHSRPFPP